MKRLYTQLLVTHFYKQACNFHPIITFVAFYCEYAVDPGVLESFVWWVWVHWVLWHH